MMSPLEIRERALLILGLQKDAKDNEIKKAYRSLVKQCHPDRSDGTPDSQARFKLIALAYEILTRPASVGKYDRLLFEQWTDAPLDARDPKESYHQWWRRQFSHLF